MNRRVVITGIGCITPLGPGLRTFWQAISGGHSGIDRITHFDCETFEVQLAAEVKETFTVPPQFSAVVAEDSKLVFALAAAEQAMEDAGLTALGKASLIHVGTSLEVLDLRKVIYQGKADFADIVDHMLSPGARPLQIPLDSAAELIESLYGPVDLKLTNVSACAASTQAIGLSFQRVREGAFEVALCGGFDSMINPLGVGGFQLLGALNTNSEWGERACRPFDAARSGTVLGEGAVLFILEPLEHALEAGKRIYAEILGYGSSLDAHKLSAPDPAGVGGISAMRRALHDARLPPEEIQAISSHGTGTYINDEVEAAAIRTVFKQTWQQIPVISTKSLTGHLIGAAGAIELSAAIQGFLENSLHPNGSLHKIAPGCELDHVVDSPRTFSGSNILKNSFGFGGQNASLIIRRTDGF
ncbi:beta-ketoacyl-[acyl-carrier-protein] synthase family protein [candidate division CSSED10-310 bacterium]|uniref:Nodulation protein E n=1 Tax=candidate division CSSED10-310 bacterium TaxID=2855610 RepID=A0ABV6YUQ2_UNCC1